MQLIANGTQGPTTVPAKQTPVGTPGYAYGGPPGSTPATDLDPDVFNTILAELQNVVMGAGLTLDPTNNAQVLAAVKLFATGRLLNVQVFSASGTYTPTTGMASVIAELVGGGGGVGGVPVTSSTQNAVSGGGGAGSYIKGRLTAAQVGASVPVTIGPGGGAGASGSGGGNGGTSSFGAFLSAPGGSGAPPSAAVSLSAGYAYAAGGGNGGTLPSGNAVSAGTGQAGNIGLITSSALINGGTGGPSHFGATPPSLSVSLRGSSNAPVSGASPGAGASGGSNNTSCAAQGGASGASGLLIVWEFS